MAERERASESEAHDSRVVCLDRGVCTGGAHFIRNQLPRVFVFVLAFCGGIDCF
jgi:hypothetical protein